MFLFGRQKKIMKSPAPFIMSWNIQVCFEIFRIFTLFFISKLLLKIFYAKNHLTFFNMTQLLFVTVTKKYLFLNFCYYHLSNRCLLFLLCKLFIKEILFYSILVHTQFVKSHQIPFNDEWTKCQIPI